MSVLLFRFFKFILQLISRYQTWAEDANVKSKTDLNDFSTRIKFLEDLESDLKVFYFKLSDIYSMFEQLLLTKVPNDVLELQKSKYTIYSATFTKYNYTYIETSIMIFKHISLYGSLF